MANVTLIGEKLAKVGGEFIYHGPLVECRTCKVKTVCFNLEVGKRYKIIKLRDMHHDCKIHEDGVRAVEFERVGVPVAINPKIAIEGSTVTFEPPDCMNRICTYYSKCHPIGIKPSTKVKIIKVGNDIKCPNGNTLCEATVED